MEVKLHPVEQEVQVVVEVVVEQDVGQLVIPLRLVHLKEIQVVLLLLVPIKLWAVAAVLVDKSKKPTQKRIVQAISNGIGTQETTSIELDSVMEEDWAEFFNINIKMRSSPILDDE